MWNIIRDLVLDRVSLELSIAFGEKKNIQNSNTSIFLNAGSLLPEHKFDKPMMLVQVVNSGKKPIVISSIGGANLKNMKQLAVPMGGLPRMLQPYEVFSTISEAKGDLIQQIVRNDIQKFWVIDTKDKKWKLSSRKWKILRETAAYIDSKKHLPINQN